MPDYTSFRQHYLDCSIVGNQGSVDDSLNIFEGNVERILGLLDGSTSISIQPILFKEYRRIFSITVRRFHEMIECRRHGLIYGLNDQLRSLFELMLQAFFLIRNENPGKAALDGYNFSIMSWHRKREEVADLGIVDRSVEAALDEKKRKVEEILSQYGKRRPKFYMDLTVKEVAVAAGLEKHYQVFYSRFSSLSHNEPSTNEDRDVFEGDKILINVIPRNLDSNRAIGFLRFANEIFLVTSTACLLSFVGVNKTKTKALVADIADEFDKGFWGKEIDTIISLSEKMCG